MATARTQGYHPGLVDLASGQISREIFVNEEIYAEEQENIFARAWLFVGHESQIPNPGDYCRLAHGRGIGDPVPRPRRRDPRVPQFVPASRHEGVPLRRGQHDRLYLPLSRLELRHRRAAGRRAVLSRGLSFEARPRQMGPRRGRAAVQLQGRDLRDLGPRGAVVRGISRADSRGFSICSSTAGTGARGRPNCCAACRNGAFRATGNSRPRISAATPITISATARSISPASARPGRSRRDLGERDVSRKLHVCIPDRGHQTILYVHAAGHRHAGRLPERADRLRVFRHCEAEKRRLRGEEARLDRRARRNLSEYGAAVAPAADDGGLASARPERDRGAGAISLSIATRRPRSRSSCATTTSAIPARPA